MSNLEMTDLEMAQYEMFRKMMGQQPLNTLEEGSIFDGTSFGHIEAMFGKKKGLKVMA